MVLIGMTPNKRMDEIIAAKLIDTLLDLGYEVMIHESSDSEDLACDLTTERDQLINNLCTFDDELIEFKRKDSKKYAGWFRMIWGNGVDIISDYSANEPTNVVYRVVEKHFNF